MRNACLIVTETANVRTHEHAERILDAFSSGGFVFAECRVLALSDKSAVSAAFIDLKQANDNVVAIVDKNRLNVLRETLKETFNHDYFQGAATGAGTYEENGKTLFLLAGDCAESGADYARAVCVPYLYKKYGTRYEKMVLRSVGAKSGYVEELMGRAREMGGGKIAVFRKKRYDEDIIEIFYDGNTPKMLADDVLRLFADGLQNSLYAIGDTTLEEQLVQLLKLRGKKISVAESFTGGGVARRIVSVSGASEVYVEGLNTYAELSKIKRLGVSDYTLRTAGAVSDQTAYEMAAGLLSSGDCDLTIATTGLSGPNSDKSGLPVGLCYIAVGYGDKVYVCRYKFDGTREEITEKAIQYALFLACRQLKNT